MTGDNTTWQPQRRYDRSGITVAEFVVVLLVVGIVLALSLIGLQSARESARRAVCVSNLREIAVASDLYHSRHDHLVSNGWGFNWGPDPDRDLGPSQPAGWVYQLAFDLDPPAAEWFSSTDASTEVHPHLSEVRCPSRPAPNRGPVTDAIKPVNYARSEIAPKTDYAINAGDRFTLPLGGPESEQTDVIEAYDWIDPSEATGISYQRSRVRVAEITDGRSHTYLVGEKHVHQAAYRSAQDPGYNQTCWSGVDLDISRWTHHRPIPDAQSGRGRQFGSAHPSIWHVAFCDGSVRSLAFTINPLVHQRNGNKADADDMPAPERRL